MLDLELCRYNYGSHADGRLLRQSFVIGHFAIVCSGTANRESSKILWYPSLVLSSICQLADQFMLVAIKPDVFEAALLCCLGTLLLLCIACIKCR